MYGFLYMDVLHVHTAIVRRITYVWLPLFGGIACSYSNRKENNICMASFIWMYCVFIQQS